jgi:DNA repair exonuclease SbcCD ATPase subunit
MKIIKLLAENFKKLTAIEITPVDNLVMITGSNGVGKSSILDAITAALCGGREIPAVPIKKGSDKGKIVIDLGEFTITRSFTKDNSYLKIENKDGSNISSPQKFLDKIVGNISFDPLDFLNNEKIKQRNILLQLLGVNVDELDKKEKALRDERTIIGRDVTKLKAVYQSENHYPEIKATEEITVISLSIELREAMEKNAIIERETLANESLKAMAKRDIDRIAAIDVQVAALIAEKEVLTRDIADKKARYVATREKLASIPKIDTSNVSTAMDTAEATNQKIRANKKWEAAKQGYDQAESQYESLTKSIEGIATERSNLLANASMPVAGLSFDDGGLLYNSIPLDQASDGEKLMVSLGISMALNPTLRVLRIKDGSLLDEKNRSIIREMVKDKDYQLWFESVGSDGKVGILIEEGEIVAVDGEPVKPKPKKPSIPPPPKQDPMPESVKSIQSTSTVVPPGEDW